MLPRILEKLLHAERDAAVGGIDGENDGLDVVAGLDQLGGVLHALGPGHFRDMDEAFDALLQLHKCAIVGDAEHTAVHARSDGIALRSVEPWIGRELYSRPGG